MELLTPMNAIIFWIITFLVVIVLPLFCLISIFKNDFPKNIKLIWVITVLFIPIFGSILYLIFGLKQRIIK